MHACVLLLSSGPPQPITLTRAAQAEHKLIVVDRPPPLPPPHLLPPPSLPPLPPLLTLLGRPSASRSAHARRRDLRFVESFLLRSVVPVDRTSLVESPLPLMGLVPRNRDDDNLVPTPRAQEVGSTSVDKFPSLLSSSNSVPTGTCGLSVHVKRRGGEGEGREEVKKAEYSCFSLSNVTRRRQFDYRLVLRYYENARVRKEAVKGPLTTTRTFQWKGGRG